MRNLISTLGLSIFLIVACRNEQNIETNKKDLDSIKKTIIQNYPTFHLPSMFLLDIENREIIFQRLGQREIIEITPLPEGKVIKKSAPKSYLYKIDSLNYQFLMDSIIHKFSNEDYKDKYEDCHDGIGNSFLYVFENEKFEDITLKNSYTENQTKLLKFLIILTQQSHPDSLIINYLNQLYEYY